MGSSDIHHTLCRSVLVPVSYTHLDVYKRQVVGDYGNEIVVRLTNGKEVVEYRDEVLIYD